MSISKNRGAETYLLRIQLAEVSDRHAELVAGIGHSLGLEGMGSIEGQIIQLIFNVRGNEIDSLQDRIVSTISGLMHMNLLSMDRVPHRYFSGFRMAQSQGDQAEKEGIRTHARVICQECRSELADLNNRRFGYPFTECPLCAPQFIVSSSDSTIHEADAGRCCPDCLSETENIHDRRYRFAENSCPACGPSLFWQKRGEARWQQSSRETLLLGTSLLRDGSIIAVKGRNGIHLLCDAGNEGAIRELRRRKGNLLKPLAVMFSGISEAQEIVEIDEQIAAALLSPTAPIVICPFRPDEMSRNLARFSVSGILDRLGVMLPHCPLMQILASLYERPLVVTSANISGQPMIHRSEDKMLLWELADAIIDHDRMILAPSGEPVIQFTESGDRIMLRNGDITSFPSVNWPELYGECVIATGTATSENSSVFLDEHFYPRGHQSGRQTTIKQGLDASAIKDSIHQHRQNPSFILSEFSTIQTQKTQHWTSTFPEARLIQIQHHEAHFAALLEEHGKLYDNEPVLGIIWDRGGTGLDGLEWGSEFIIKRQGRFEQFISLDYFQGTAAEPDDYASRLAALGLLRHRLDARRLIGHLFSRDEWRNYERWPIRSKEMNTRSMSRLIDGVFTIIGIATEGKEAGMLDGLPILETLARRIQMDVSQPYELPIRNQRVDWRPMIDTIIGDLDSGAGRDMIARRFLSSLAELVCHAANLAGVRKIALSGDVFCSPMLVTMIADRLGRDRTLYIHQGLAPTDECIPLGQLAVWALQRKSGQSGEAARKKEVHDPKSRE
jgi:hydrogenase maturation protein HypF